ncbi:hypothetical protein MAPG_06737 [Magnaporthiopsis poae ATCC 64411]|uniref:HMG box domain-containing protein n=1 Tax=Magnaporthiopsis poae (strain ATCC 64411 / 73-15) TaxID=644358 RepID=A0A0C4E2U6_MAGP6|nr:hypothetical protein MAPG_06737 [Magnaporthiopsis poae ATCC 64411]
MSQSLGEIFGELGISQYLDAFVDQGFDTWDTILDITESDLDALGVKLGHRRKLQRRIANSRGVAPEAALASPTISPTQRNLEEQQRQDAHRAETPRADAAVGIITKRKYRRHPKADENAPERPPSAYVLFSNKMRDDLKDQHLTFTEIAKLVGEHWQALAPSEKEPYETQAQTAKDKYNHDLAEYKKTPQYKEYLAYLQDFKLKHAAPSGEKENLKRVKLSEGSASPCHPSAPRRARSHTTPAGGSSTASSSVGATGASSEGRKTSEPPPGSRDQRVGSVASVPEYGSSANYPIDRSSVERSPSRSSSPHEGSVHHAPYSNPNAPPTIDGHAQYQHTPQQQQHHTLPSLSNILENPGQGEEGRGGFNPFQGGSPALHEHHAPALKKEFSSGASPSSSAASVCHPRTPVEGSLPIHLLLVSGQGKAGAVPGLEQSAMGRPSERSNPLKRSASPESRPSSLLHYAHHHHLASDPLIKAQGITTPKPWRA